MLAKITLIIISLISFGEEKLVRDRPLHFNRDNSGFYIRRKLKLAASVGEKSVTKIGDEDFLVYDDTPINKKWPIVGTVDVPRGMNHEAIFYSDGTNSGYYRDGGVRGEHGEELKFYRDNGYSAVTVDPELEKFVKQAEKNIAPSWRADNYDMRTHNCQHYIDAVADEATRLFKIDRIARRELKKILDSLDNPRDGQTK
jgi:hypothetical protein